MKTKVNNPGQDMKFADMSTVNSNKEMSVLGGQRPRVLVNNFMSEDSQDKPKSRAVLFNGEGSSQTRDRRTSSVSKQEDLDARNAKAATSNGYRPNSSKSSDSLSVDNRDLFRTSAGKRRTSSRSSVSSVMSSARRISIRSEDQRSCSKGWKDRNRTGSISSESTDDGCALSPNSTPQNFVTPWEAFENHLKSVHIPIEFVTQKSRITFKSSDTFQQTMTEIYGLPQYGMEVPKPKPKGANFSNFASRLIATNRRRRQTSQSVIKEVPEKPPQPSKTVVENARRGWRVIRRYVNEMIAEKKGSNAAFNWSMLTQTVRGMTDMEKARIDLYKRYGIIPTVQPDGTTVQVNTMLSERARASSAGGSSISSRRSAFSANSMVPPQTTLSRRHERASRVARAY